MKKRTIRITAIAGIAVGLFFLIAGLAKPKQDYSEYFTLVPDMDKFIGYAKPQKEILCGGYTEQHELSNEDKTLFRKVLGEAPFTPLSVATQVVAGLNYRFWCRYDDGTENSPGHCFITIYQPLQGEPVISKIQDENGGPEMMKVCEGQGILTLKDTGKKPVFSRPDSNPIP